MNREYVETVTEVLEGITRELRTILESPLPPKQLGEVVLEDLYKRIGQSRRLLLFVYSPKPEPGAWRQAIGCAPRRGGDEMTAEEAIRRVRGDGPADPDVDDRTL